MFSRKKKVSINFIFIDIIIWECIDVGITKITVNAKYKYLKYLKDGRFLSIKTNYIHVKELICCISYILCSVL